MLLQHSLASRVLATATAAPPARRCRALHVDDSERRTPPRSPPASRPPLPAAADECDLDGGAPPGGEDDLPDSASAGLAGDEEDDGIGDVTAERRLEIEFVLAASEGELDVVEDAVTSGGVNIDAVDIDGSTALMAASFAGHEDVVRYLLSRGASINVVQEKYGWTPLIAAAYSGNAAITGVLLAAGANVEYADGEVS